MQTGTKNIIKRIVDVGMTVLLLCLMAYQVTGEALHEWIGMGMTALVVFHQILNRKWYASIFTPKRAGGMSRGHSGRKGKYHALRVLMTAVNVLLIASFILTAFCGMSMSGYAVPFLYGMAPVSFVRRMHLSMSHWSFVLMGLHLGIHIPAMTARIQWKDRTRNAIVCAFTVASGVGLYLFLKNNMPDYLFFRVPFAFLDYEKAGILVFVENLMMLLFWAFIGTEASVLCRAAGKKDQGKKNPLFPICCMMAAVIIGLVMWMAMPGDRSDNNFSTGGWDTTQESTETINDEISVQDEQGSRESAGTVDYDVNDTFVRIDGGSFLMGSPESENWRIDDEKQAIMS